MARKRYTAEEIIGHLRTIEIETGKGFGIAEVCRKLGITEQNCGTNCSTANSPVIDHTGSRYEFKGTASIGRLVTGRAKGLVSPIGT